MAFLVVDQSCLCLQRLIACFANILFPPFLSMHCAFVPNDRDGSQLLLAEFTFKNCSTQIFKFKLQFSFVIYSLFKPIRGHRLFELLSFWAFYLLARLNWPPWTAGWTIILKLIRHNLINKSGLKKPNWGFVSRKCSVSKSPSETSEFVINSNTII